MFKTIAAISTPRGKGGIAVIRISGDETREIISKCFRPRRGAEALLPRVATYGTVVDPRDGRVVDDGILTLFPGPASYTGEDVAEISCHGGVYVTGAVLSAVYAAGAEPAGPGDFTKRAYINGKLTLSRAEAVGKLLDARTEAQARLASAGTRGVLSDRLSAIRGELLTLLSSVYAAIDYPDEDMTEVPKEELSRRLAALQGEVSALADTYRTGRAVAEGIRTVICGAPNAGKSSVYNLLTASDRAIVTDVAGTTRDVLEDCVSLGGVTLLLWDTAGLRETEDTVERIGVQRARAKMEEAELALAVFDTGRPETEEDRAFCREASRAPASIALLNKTDKKREMSPAFEAEIRAAFPHVIELAAGEGQGREDVEACIRQMFLTEGLDLGADPIVSEARQHAALTRAAESLTAAAAAIGHTEGTDIVGFLAEKALADLEMTDGRAVSDEIVSEIFHHFCVGK